MLPSSSCGTFIYTWIFNRTGDSLLLVMLTHAASNAASQWLNALVELLVRGGMALVCCRPRGSSASRQLR